MIALSALPALAAMPALGPDWLDPTQLDRFGAAAFWIALLIVFAECGLLIGFFLPGDSLLFMVGLFVANGVIGLPLWLACLLLTLAAVLGNLTGYWIGRKAGPAFFNRPDSRLFRKEYVDKTHSFFDRYGPKAIVLARFVPIVRTFITAMAGVGRMNLKSYALFSTIGGVIWATGVTMLGYFLGNVAFIQHNLEVMLLAIVAVSVVPIAFEAIKHRRGEAALLHEVVEHDVAHHHLAAETVSQKSAE
ncbi:MAG: VTT domain-containing protein [Candidatus Nanopelagicales bacterium]